jgi:hypothetical protein
MLGWALPCKEAAMKGDRVRFEETLEAIATIKQEDLRNDFGDLLKGADYALNRGDYELANLVIDRLAGMAHALGRTIGGYSATRMIEGMVNDARAISDTRLRPPGWDRGKRCDLSGSRKCIPSRGHSCHEDPTGCISGADRFTDFHAGYIWAVTLL